MWMPICRLPLDNVVTDKASSKSKHPSESIVITREPAGRCIAVAGWRSLRTDRGIVHVAGKSLSSPLYTSIVSPSTLPVALVLQSVCALLALPHPPPAAAAAVGGTAEDGRGGGGGVGRSEGDGEGDGATTA